MSSVRREIAIVAGPRDWGDTRESWLAKVSERVEALPYRTVKAIFYGEITDENHWAIIELRRAVAIIEAQRELKKLQELQEALSSRLRIADEGFYSEEIARLGNVLNAARDKNRT